MLSCGLASRYVRKNRVPDEYPIGAAFGVTCVARDTKARNSAVLCWSPRTYAEVTGSSPVSPSSKALYLNGLSSRLVWPIPPDYTYDYTFGGKAPPSFAQGTALAHRDLLRTGQVVSGRAVGLPGRELGHSSQGFLASRAVGTSGADLVQGRMAQRACLSALPR